GAVAGLVSGRRPGGGAPAGAGAWGDRPAAPADARAAGRPARALCRRRVPDVRGGAGLGGGRVRGGGPPRRGLQQPAPAGGAAEGAAAGGREGGPGPAGGVAAGGMTAALVGAGVARDADIVLADEWRLGVRGPGREGLAPRGGAGRRGQVRKVLAPRGARVVQRLQLRYQWTYLLLAVDPRAGRLRWRWLERCRAEAVQPGLAGCGPDAGVWDGHGAQDRR